MDATLLDRYLRLYHHPELGQADLARLLVCHGDLDGITRSVRHGEFITSLLHSPRSTESIDRVHDWLQEDGHHLVLYEQDGYPPLLKQLAVPPPLLFLRGSPDCLLSPSLAAVGARKCTAYGQRQAKWLAGELAAAGLTIVSGMARGIDGACHEAALARGGQTIAVVGTGINRVYPARHAGLAQRIAESGALVSEFPLDTPPRPANFPRRNRIISGLAAGTLVVEATLRSGSLISARQAAEQNREVFAVPGPIGQQTSLGCHALIKQGAKLVEAPEDVLEELPGELTAGLSGNAPAFGASEDDEDQAAISTAAAEILKVMAGQTCLYETLLQHTRLSAAELTATLVEMEIQGLIDSEGGRYAPLR